MVTWTQYRIMGYGLLKQGENGIDYQQVELELKTFLNILFCQIISDAFKKMPTDEKLVSLFEIMTSGFGSMNKQTRG